MGKADHSVLSTDAIARIATSRQKVELCRSDLAGHTTVMYAWKNRNGSNMSAMFQDGALVSKAQFGLP